MCRNYLKINKKIEESLFGFADTKNILIGICDAENIEVGYEISDIPFAIGDIAMRTNPKLFFEKAESVVVFGLPYEESRNSQAINDVLYGKLAIGTSGIDYHTRLKDIMIECIELMQRITPVEYKLHIDTGPLIEREFAKKAGLGFIGKNSMLINSIQGSYFNIGLMLVDIPLNSTPKNNADTCGDCNLCEKACIGRAICKDGFDYRHCVSYLTQKKGELSESEKLLLNGFIYGCDICQRVCPFNKFRHLPNEIVPLDEFLELSNKQFQDLYGATSIAWRGKKVLQRNAEAIKYVENTRT